MKAEEIAAAVHVLDEILTDAGLGIITTDGAAALKLVKTRNVAGNIGVNVRIALGLAIVRRARAKAAV